MVDLKSKTEARNALLAFSYFSLPTKFEFEDVVFENGYTLGEIIVFFQSFINGLHKP